MSVLKTSEPIGAGVDAFSIIHSVNWDIKFGLKLLAKFMSLFVVTE